MHTHSHLGLGRERGEGGREGGGRGGGREGGREGGGREGGREGGRREGGWREGGGGLAQDRGISPSTVVLGI